MTLDRALLLARRGYRVFPVNRDTKAPYTDIVRSWPNDATNSEVIIRRWWKQYPDAEVGLPVPPGTVVLDVDDPKLFGDSGHTVLDTALYRTPSGGIHAFYRTPAGEVPQVTRQAEGFDTRGAGKGYVVAWNPKSIPQVQEWTEAPDWLYGLAETTATAGAEESVHASNEGGDSGGLDRDQAALLGVPVRSGRRAGLIRCPAHDDRDPSLSWKRTPEDTFLLFCHAGCKFEDITATLGFTLKGVTEYKQKEPPVRELKLTNPQELFVNIRDYLADVPTTVPWLAEPFAYAGGVTLLAGIWKGGKSTLAAQLQRARETGDDFLGHPVAQGLTVLVTEEGGIPVRHKAAGLNDLLILDRRKAVQQELELDDVLANLRNLLSGHEAPALVFIDTFAVWGDIEDENSATEMTAALAKLTVFAQETNAGVVLIHHLRKEGGAHGRGIRGSGALPATVDIFATLDYVDSSDDRRLLLEGRVIAPMEFTLAFDRTTMTYRITEEGSALGALWVERASKVFKGATKKDLATIWGVSTTTVDGWVTTLESRSMLRREKASGPYPDRFEYIPPGMDPNPRYRGRGLDDEDEDGES